MGVGSSVSVVLNAKGDGVMFDREVVLGDTAWTAKAREHQTFGFGPLAAKEGFRVPRSTKLSEHGSLLGALTPPPGLGCGAVSLWLQRRAPPAPGQGVPARAGEALRRGRPSADGGASETPRLGPGGMHSPS